MIHTLRAKPRCSTPCSCVRNAVADERRPGRRDRQLESAEQLQVAELAPHCALLFGSERARPGVGAPRFEQQRAVGSQHANGDGRVVFQECSGDAADRVVIARAQGIFERGCGGRGEIAGERVETLQFGL